MTKPDWKLIARQLNERLDEERMSSLELANKAGVDRKTVERLRGGHAVRGKTLQWIEQALKTTLGNPVGDNPDAAPASFGGYLRSAVSTYVGEYIACRRSFDTATRIIASYLEIHWDEQARVLRFNESQDNRLASGKAYAYHFDGDVLIPPNLGVMHFVVRTANGLVRQISTSMPREDGGTLYMKGFILTLNELRDIGYYPVCSPIFLARAGAAVTAGTGILQAGDAGYAWANEILDDIEQKFLPARRLSDGPD